MPIRRLRTRFILARVPSLAAVLGIGLWSALTFARLSSVVGRTLQESQEVIELSAGLAHSLEREDDALLLAIGGKIDQARRDLQAERQRGDRYYGRLAERAQGQPRQQHLLALGLRQQIEAYHTAGSELLASALQPDAMERYQGQVNPLLRLAVETCGQLREENFESMQKAGILARDEARWATGLILAAAGVAFALASLVALWLARSVLGPVRELTGAVESLRRGDFDSRVPLVSADEMGHLAMGFNRMAETLAEYRRSSLGDVLAAKNTLEATLDALPDAVLLVAPDGSMAALNQPAQAVLRAKNVEEARQVRDLPLSPEHQAAVGLALAGRATMPRQPDFQHTFDVSLEGQPRRFMLTAVPVPECAPGQTGAVVVLHDVTEFARLDELRAELIGMASHELKSPLTTLRMNLLMLMEHSTGLSQRQQQLLAAAVQGCEELGSTIEELLDITRVEAGQLRLNLAPVELGAVLASAHHGLQPRFEDEGVALQVLMETSPALVLGDAARLASVFTNLLTNALKYSPRDSTVTVRVASAQKAGKPGPAAVQIGVADRGPGIPAEYRERVFEKFFRVEHHTGPPGSGVRGTGIGLYLCREIVKAHGGTIWCEPGDGGLGTRVVVDLPRR